jgi:hypothetical protein
MELREFDYSKDGIEVRKKEVWIFNEDESYLSGLETYLLDLEEKEEVLCLLRDKILVEDEDDTNFKIAMKPYMKAWRKFKKEKIVVPKIEEEKGETKK